jgi:UDP-N-acetylglucosamine:LPS N-acetylglucosamine transferase
LDLCSGSIGWVKTNRFLILLLHQWMTGVGLDIVISKMSLFKKKVLAVASGGGHWIQLLRMTPAFSEHEVVYLTTLASYRSQVGSSRFHVVPNASRWNKAALMLMAVKIIWILLRERPAIVISTGAAPGYFAIRFGKLVGAKTIWVDSIANAQKLSLSGKSIGKFADLWLTQWPHLARPEGPYFCGAVL